MASDGTLLYQSFQDKSSCSKGTDKENKEYLNQTFAGSGSSYNQQSILAPSGGQSESNKRRDGDEGEPFSPRKDSKPKRRKISFQGLKQFSIGLLEFKRRRNKNQSNKEPTPMTRHVSMDNIHCRRQHGLSNSFTKHSTSVHPTGSTSDLSFVEGTRGQSNSGSKSFLFRSFHGRNGMSKESTLNKSTEDFMKMLDRCEQDNDSHSEYSTTSDTRISDSETNNTEEVDSDNTVKDQDLTQTVKVGDSESSSSNLTEEQIIANRFSQQVHIDNERTPCIGESNVPPPSFSPPAIAITYSSDQEQGSEETCMETDQSVNIVPNIQLNLKSNFEEIIQNVHKSHNSSSDPNLSISSTGSLKKDKVKSMF